MEVLRFWQHAFYHRGGWWCVGCWCGGCCFHLSARRANVLLLMQMGAGIQSYSLGHLIDGSVLEYGPVYVVFECSAEAHWKPCKINDSWLDQTFDLGSIHEVSTAIAKMHTLDDIGNVLSGLGLQSLQSLWSSWKPLCHSQWSKGADVDWSGGPWRDRTTSPKRHRRYFSRLMPMLGMTSICHIFFLWDHRRAA